MFIEVGHCDRGKENQSSKAMRGDHDRAKGQLEGKIKRDYAQLELLPGGEVGADWQVELRRPRHSQLALYHFPFTS